MIRTAYLRFYQPLTTFPLDEQQQWLEHSSENSGLDNPSSKRWLITTSLPDMSPTGPSEGAFARKVSDEVFICPWRTRLRMLAGLLAFRSSVPDEVADAFVPEVQARSAAAELADIGREQPHVRSHILHANWHVPIRWFGCFDDKERILTEDKDGLRLRYETSAIAARTRIARTVSVLEESWIDEGITLTVKELLEWIDGFPEQGLLELDYGTVARMFTDEELLEDRSARDVSMCLDSLESGDVLRAGRLFAELTDRWTGARSFEVVN